MDSNHHEHGNALINRTLIDSFIELHRSQLQLSGVPTLFYENLFRKLQDQVESIIESANRWYVCQLDLRCR